MSRSRFLFHAFAAGLGGKIHRPFEEVLEVQAPAALPPSGGASTSSVKDVKIRELFSCASTTSSARGEFHAATDTYETRVSSSVERFNLGGVVTVDLIRAQVHSSHKADGGEPNIVPDGTRVENLRVNDVPIELENLTSMYTKLKTLTAIREKHREDEEFRRRIHELCMIGRSEDLAEFSLHRFFPFSRRKPDTELHEANNATVLPLFRILSPSGRGFHVVQNAIYIENFGRLHVGELIVTPYEQRVTGLHVELGSPQGGELTAASVSGNGGHTDPPGLEDGT